MKKEELFEAIGELNVENTGKKTAKQPKIKSLRYVAIAAALIVALAVPVTAYSIEAVRYNAAVGYLRSLGIDAEDMSNYSKSEIIWTVQYRDAGGSTIIYNLAPHVAFTESMQEPTSVTSEQVKRLTPTMTREEVIAELGETADVGSGIYIYVYRVDDLYELSIPFTSYDAQLGVSGEMLLKALRPKG